MMAAKVVSDIDLFGGTETFIIPDPCTQSNGEKMEEK